MWPTRFVIFKVVIERLFPPFGRNSFGVPPNHIAPTPVLDVVDDWPRSTTRAEWFRLTHDLIQSVIDDMDLDPDSLSQVEEAFISAGLL